MGLKFPRGFVFGFSEAGFQFEMGLPGSEDPNTDWWIWVHDPENIAAGIVSGDLPENGPGYWNLYKQDHDLADRLGMDGARIGIEWSRVFPKPTLDVKISTEIDRDGNVVYVDVDERALEELDRLANREAVNHYREMLRDWKDRGKILIVNLYHWPLPIWIHDPIKVRRFGPDRAPSGWLDSRTVVEFAKYAAYIAWKLGDLPDMWSTMNEPNVVYSLGYMNARAGFPPGYLCFEAGLKAARHLIEAHARAYDMLKRYADKPTGIIYATTVVEPLTHEHRDAAEVAYRMQNFEFLDSIVFGRSSFIGERKDLERHLDYIGVNYYTRQVVVSSKTLLGWSTVPGYGFACQPGGVSATGRPCSESGWEIYPEGMLTALEKFWKRYGLPLMVTENGIADAMDRYRSRYIVSHLAYIHRAIEGGVDVKGYLHWALIDNYEWARGFGMRFGLHYVDLNTKKRYPRPSALVFKEIARNKEVVDELLHLVEI
ncbi:MAG: beta-galactosidase BgaS [Ignisphaera sp.]|uniref:Glycoside hydrolase family 1 protein n=1 Tax=Ignisphaera aggregans TaxID=334771 RepID=A0A7J3JQD3_9CREN